MIDSELDKIGNKKRSIPEVDQSPKVRAERKKIHRKILAESKMKNNPISNSSITEKSSVGSFKKYFGG